MSGPKSTAPPPSLSSPANASKPQPPLNFRLYKRRWIILAVFMGYAINGGSQWMEFTIISDLMVEYYGISYVMVEWTTMIFMLAYIFLIMPSLYLLNMMGIRKSIILAGSGICIGSWIKAFAVAPDRFPLLFTGQVFQAIFQVLTFGLAARLTAVWFGANEISMAGALALFGDQLGCALGFSIPTILVKPGTSTDERGKDLTKLNMLVAVISTCILTLVVFCIREEPKIPPSAAQIIQKNSKEPNISGILVNIFKNGSFLLMLVSYGTNVGGFNALATMLNQITLHYYPGHNKDAGNLGFILMISGIVGSIIIAFVLDKTHSFKKTTVFVTVCTLITTCALTFGFKYCPIYVIYLIAVVHGFFTMGYYGTGVQMGIEVTYPVSEGISAGIMFLSAQLFGLFLTFIYSRTMKIYGPFYSNLVMCGVYSVSFLAAYMIPSRMKRQCVEANTTEIMRETPSEGENLIHYTV